MTQAENTVLIMNGDPGLKKLTTVVNGVVFKTTGLRDGEVRSIDISSALKPGDRNKILVKGHGPKDSTAMVVVSDGSVQP